MGTQKDTNTKDAAKTVGAKTDEVAKDAASAADNIKDTVETKAADVADQVKEKIDSVPTDDAQEKVDDIQKKVADKLQGASKAVKKGFEDHGIDTDKLSESLKEDASAAATTVVGGAKLAAEKIGGFVSQFKDGSKKDTDPGDKAN